MIEFIQNFHFLRPWVLLFLLLPVGFYIRKIGIQNYLSSWENFCDKNLLKYLLITGGSQKRISLKKYIYTGLIVTTLAAAGPTWKKIEIPSFVVENPTMFLLSLARDMQLTDISPSRLERSKFAISDIAELVPEGQFGLEVYSKEPYIITPLTDDIKVIKNLLPQITPDIVPDQGDRLDRAIDLAIARFKAAGYTNGNIVIFASDVGQRLDLALNKVQEASRANYIVHIIDTSFYGNDKLQMLAEKGKGIYLSLKDPQMQKVADKLKNENDEKIKLSENLRANFLDYGYYLVFVSLICLLPFFRRGLLIFILLIGFTSQAQAGFLLNDNQEGLKLFNSEQYDLALKKFKDNLWRSVTLYKMDKKEEALKELSSLKTDTAYYNKGVILTKLCKYKEALEAFDESLKLNPNNEDAIYNKQVLTDLFEKSKEDPSVLSCDDEQEQEQQQQNQNNDSDENQDQNNQSPEQQNQDNQDNQQQDDNSNSQQNQEQQDKNQASNKDDSSSDEQQDKKEQTQEEQKQQENDKSQAKNNPNNNSKQDNPDDTTAKNDSQQNKQQENDNTPSKANNDNGDEQKSDNQKGDDNNATDMQEEEVETQVMNTKQGDDDTKYDEEALAMQRRYREIPEDPGGLLREFIKKEYMKDRYHDENM